MKPTEIGLHKSFEVHSHVLCNGLKVLLVENPSIPTVSMNASIMVGARYDPESKAGLAIMVSRLLDEGTESRTSFEIADAIESVGQGLEHARAEATRGLSRSHSQAEPARATARPVAAVTARS